MPLREALRAAYDRDAPRYEERFAALQAVKIEAALAQAPPQAGETVLDLGCGTGLLLRALRRREPSLRLLGLDLSRGMLRAGDLTGAAALQGDLCALPLRAATLDRVYALTSFLVPRPEAARGFLEVARALRPGGVFVLTLLEADAWPGLAADLAAAGLAPEAEFSAGQDLGWVCQATGGA